MLRFLFRNLKGYYLLTGIAIVMSVTQVGFDLLGAFPFKFSADKIQKNIDPPSFLGGFISFFDQFDTSQNLINRSHSLLGVIVFSALLIIVLSLFSAISTYIQLSISSFIAQHLLARLRKQLFEHLQTLTLDWYSKQKEGDLIQRITGDMTYIERLITGGMVNLFAGALTFVGVITVMLLINWQFTLLTIIVVPPLAIIVFKYTFIIKVASRRARQTAGEVANIATEDIRSITILKAFTIEEREAIRFGEYVRKNLLAGLRTGNLQAQFTPIVTILLAIGTAIIVGIGAFIAGGHNFKILFLTIPRNSLSIGDLTIFLIYLKLLYQPMSDLSRLTNVATNAVASAERIQEVLDQVPENFESNVPYCGSDKLIGDISYEKVVFGYSKHRNVLKEINLHIPAGKKVALVGLSGSGKTTMISLIPRFYEIQQGSIKIDGIDNRMYPLALLRRNVSLVLQDSILFAGTIRENIEMGKPGALIEEIIDSAKKAQIHEMILSLPDGYNTRVLEQGKNFSGGQRQRLAIARAILRDAPILILDEPAASLDVEAEVEIMHVLSEVISGRTVLIISHRLSTLGNVDQIVVLKDGCIMEQGTFNELKQSGGMFADLLKKQNHYNPDR